MCGRRDRPCGGAAGSGPGSSRWRGPQTRALGPLSPCAAAGVGLQPPELFRVSGTCRRLPSGQGSLWLGVAFALECPGGPRGRGSPRSGTWGCGLPSRGLVAKTESSDKEGGLISVNVFLVCKQFHAPCLQ